MKSILMNCLLVLGTCLMMSCGGEQSTVAATKEAVPATKASKATSDDVATKKTESKAGKKTGGTSVSGEKLAEVQNLKPTQFKNIIRANSSAVVIDVRTPNECQAGIYKNAIMLNYNDGTFDAKLNSLDKKTAYLVYCASGGRSSKATDKMVELGFEKVYNLVGGYDDIK